MHLFKYAILLLLFNISPLKLSAQIETQASVIERIDLGIKYLSEKNHAKSLEELIGAKELAIREEWYSQAFNASLNIGNNYYLLMDYGEAFQYYLQAYEIAVKHLSARQEMVAFNNIGVLYTEDKDLIKAKKSFLKAYEIAKKLDDKEKIGAYAINLALLGNKMGELELSEKYIDEGLPLINDNLILFLSGEIARAENLLLRAQYVKAENLALKLLPQINDLSILRDGMTVNDRITVLLILTQVYEEQKQFKLAQKYALLARSSRKDIEGRKEIYNHLARLYYETNDFVKAMAYKDSVVIATDSLYAIKNTALFKSEQVKFQIHNYQHELSESKEKLQGERQFFYGLIICVVLFMGFLILVYKYNSLKHKQQKKIAELKLAKEKNSHLLIERQNQERKAQVLLERERFKNELDNKNRELTSKAMFLSSKNELIEEIVQTLSANTQIETNAVLKKQINELKKHLKKDTQWDSFFVHFEDVNQGFLDRLRAQHPNLTSSDIRFTTFLYMNLTYKEIASLLNITPQSCRKRKERISKKMNIASNLSIHMYLSSI
ncbi:TPR domain protein [Psychroflexus torquis ATCC 700755]|uniref:TPR domain protein n=1 Tax=Psychroflexus torquis (strain ATCC 700755 / CIP 106069 / ACAM 623) TaxID=313595 RepID=K4IJ46_PSYTT|nr:tetratricopeptide repeat protein [Psychroflexus torquis]AFU70567.1 TPR domain protein [Psychroflexus torquis ATCC 700755]